MPAQFDFSDLGGTRRGIDFSDLGGQYHLHESELTSEPERPIAFISGGRKYQVHPSQWDKVQKVDPKAKLV